MKPHPNMPLVFSLLFILGCVSTRLIPPNSPLVDRPWLSKPAPLPYSPPLPPMPPGYSSAQARVAPMAVAPPPVKTNRVVMSATFPYFTADGLMQTNIILFSTSLGGPFQPVYTNYAFSPTNFIYTNFTTAPMGYYRSVRSGSTNNEPPSTNGYLPL